MSKQYRRARRKDVPERIEVFDTMLDTPVGSIGNISESGMLLVATVPVPDDALYQFRFALPANGRAQEIEVGAHQIWSDASRGPGQNWVGFRFIDISPKHLDMLRAYIGPGEE